MQDTNNATSTVSPMQSAGPVWLNVEQAARHLGVGPGLIYRACAAGRLRHVRVGARRHGLLRFRVEWLDAYMESCAAGVEVAPISAGRP
jgi:excisionase family DNA binding protein